jgi:cytochrome P450
VAEIRSTFPTESSISFQIIQDLPYMNACIKEGLRIFPPVPAGLLRTVPKDGDTIDGHWVPGGTSVAVSSWAACHSSNNWKDPEVYEPERWLEGAGYENDELKASQAFSLGPRGCIGRHLSYMEMRLIMARLLWNFDLKAIGGEEEGIKQNGMWEPSGEMKYMRAYLTWEKPELNVRLIPVQRP